MTELPKAPIGRIMKEAGAERISEESKEELAKYLKEIAFEVTIEAKKAAKFAKRKTIKPEDIKLAIKYL